jgi:hypothetical protein
VVVQLSFLSLRRQNSRSARQRLPVAAGPVRLSL